MIINISEYSTNAWMRMSAANTTREHPVGSVRSIQSMSIQRTRHTGEMPVPRSRSALLRVTKNKDVLLSKNSKGLHNIYLRCCCSTLALLLLRCHFTTTDCVDPDSRVAGSRWRVPPAADSYSECPCVTGTCATFGICDSSYPKEAMGSGWEGGSPTSSLEWVLTATGGTLRISASLVGLFLG